MAKKKATNKATKIEQVIAAQGRTDGLYLVKSIWFESDAVNAVGQVFRDDWAREDSDISYVLNTNDGLSSIWSSPGDNLWLGSGRGNIYTTAAVQFSPHRMTNLDYDAADADLNWNVTTLPDMHNFGYRPNITALWGTSDDQVFAGTFKGGIYQWNGKIWKQTFWETEATINRFHGTGPDNVYAVGRDGTILHFNGTQWRRLPYIDDDGEGRNLTGVFSLSKKETLVVGTDGRILLGNENGMSILAEFKAGFYGIGVIGKETYLAGGDQGIFKLDGKKISNVKSTVATVGVFEAKPKLLLVEPSQDAPSLIEYDPEIDPSWWKRVY